MSKIKNWENKAISKEFLSDTDTNGEKTGGIRTFADTNHSWWNSQMKKRSIVVVHFWKIIAYFAKQYKWKWATTLYFSLTVERKNSLLNRKDLKNKLQKLFETVFGPYQWHWKILPAIHKQTLSFGYSWRDVDSANVDSDEGYLWGVRLRNNCTTRRPLPAATAFEPWP